MSSQNPHQISRQLFVASCVVVVLAVAIHRSQNIFLPDSSNENVSNDNFSEVRARKHLVRLADLGTFDCDDDSHNILYYRTMVDYDEQDDGDCG